VADCIPYFEPAEKITVHAAVAVTGKRFVDVSAGPQAAFEGLDTAATPTGGNITVGLPTAAGLTLGVAAFDAAAGSEVTIYCGNQILPVQAAAAITAGAELQVDATGQVVPLAAGRAVGRAMAAAASGADCPVKLYTR
jgi:predicted RecA/RadA family phage recombinase